MAKKYNPNQDLIDAANTAAACGMSYGEWMAKGCPVPSKKQKRKKRNQAAALSTGMAADRLPGGRYELHNQDNQ